MAADLHPDLGVVVPVTVRGQLQHPLLEPHTVVPALGALVHLAQDVVQRRNVRGQIPSNCAASSRVSRHSVQTE